MLQVALAEIGAWTDACDAHLPHATLHMLAIYIPAFKAKFLRDSATSVDRIIRLYFIYSILEFHLRVRQLGSLVIQIGAVQAQDACLRP